MESTRRIELDLEPLRAQRRAHSGGCLFVGVVVQAGIGSAVAGAIIAPMAKAVSPWDLFQFAALTTFAMAAGYAVIGYSVNHWYTAAVLRRYALPIGWGTYETQERHLTVGAAASTLWPVVDEALRALHQNVELERYGGYETVAYRGDDPPLGAQRGLHSAVRVRLHDLGNGQSRVDVYGIAAGSKINVRRSIERSADLPHPRSLFRQLTEQAVFDHGRSIENVEEFQLALKRLIEQGQHENGGSNGTA